MTNNNHDGRHSAQGEGALDLSAEFSADDFLDPAFLAGLANQLYADGHPPLPAAHGAADAEVDGAALGMVRDIPEHVPPREFDGLSALHSLLFR